MIRCIFTFVFVLIASGAVFAEPALPDHTLTPGHWFNPPPPLRVLCAPGYTAKVRKVSPAMRMLVFRRYHLDPEQAQRAGMKIDHVVPLEIGGDNTVWNLYPQTKEDAALKDRAEGRAHKAVCSGAVLLRPAQEAFATDWIHSYFNVPGH